MKITLIGIRKKYNVRALLVDSQRFMSINTELKRKKNILFSQFIFVADQQTIQTSTVFLKHFVCRLRSSPKNVI